MSQWREYTIFHQFCPNECCSSIISPPSVIGATETNWKCHYYLESRPHTHTLLYSWTRISTFEKFEVVQSRCFQTWEGPSRAFFNTVKNLWTFVSSSTVLLPRAERDHWHQIGGDPTQALVSGYFPVFGAAAAAACPQVKQRHGKNSMNTLRIWGARLPRPLPRYLERRFQLFNRQGDFVIKTKNVDGNPDWGGVSCHHAFYSVHLNAQHCLSIKLKWMSISVQTSQ